MAEILGLVSGGAGLLSLAGQLGSSAIKLARFYETAKGAPNALKALSSELKMTALLLEELERHRQYDQHNSYLLLHSIHECQKSTNKIVELVEMIELVLRKYRRLGRFYYPYKEKEVEKSISELERAKSTLTLALTSYLQLSRSHDAEVHGKTLPSNNESLAVIQSQNVAILQQLALISNPRSDAATDSISIINTPSKAHSEAARRDRSTRKARKMEFKVKLSPWFCNTLLDIAFTNALGVWNISITPTRIVPDDSLIFEYCAAGDVKNVRLLLESGEFTVRDTSPDQRGLIWYASAYHHLDLCRYLFQKLAAEDIDEDSACCFYLWLLSPNPSSVSTDLCRALVEELGMDLPVDEYCTLIAEGGLLVSSEWGKVMLTVAAWLTDPSLFMQHQVTLFKSHNLETRLELVRYCTLAPPPKSVKRSPHALLAALCHEELDSDLAKVTARSGFTCLHFVAFSIATSPKRNKEWIVFLRDLVRLGADTSAHSTASTTPLWCLVSGYLACHNDPGDLPTVLYLVRLWAQTLHEAGRSLDHEGAKEAELWRQGSQRIHAAGVVIRFRALQLIYGPRPIDWDIVFVQGLHIPVYRLSSTPGAWPSSKYVPQSIIWEPRAVEEDEGKWIKQKELLLTYTYIRASRLEPVPNSGNGELLEFFDKSAHDDLCLNKDRKHCVMDLPRDSKERSLILDLEMKSQSRVLAYLDLCC